VVQDVEAHVVVDAVEIGEDMVEGTEAVLVEIAVVEEAMEEKEVDVAMVVVEEEIEEAVEEVLIA